MGLRLHNSSDALDLDLTQRYLSPGPPQVNRPQPRAHYNGAYFHADGSIALNRELAGLKLPLLDLILTANHQKRARRQRQTSRRQTHRSTRQWRTDEAAEGRTLASSGHRLPGEQHRRTPSLEREEAFRDPRTTKSRLHPDDAPDVAQLYRMGLLYDDEHLRGSAFGLDLIDHLSEPEYTTRPAKRARKSKPRQPASYDDDVQLALDLSLAELGRDESFAQFLCSPDLDELPSGDESDGSTYSARLAPLQFVSELVQSPEYFSDNTLPELTTDSDSDSSASYNFSSDEDDSTGAEPGKRLNATTEHDGTNQEFDRAPWMVPGDGS
ncbi:hypothetical protein CORC01_12223 [Colletotrichum orchidophilum]|uniref:Uncharacterized protein n=1 Tax=Colletotrichum orchidophilum TaxID=1209926 RepID=A0A1G4ATS5_9PEZI|nr:uncharacterized protein CORC01_12223 [Colletotrichum orchidophilum]OHE92505.1 hypothetical protein CORC01_12223 [Colletotrichum orchidophilum]